MNWSPRLFTIAGTAIRVHLTFALLLLWIGIMHYRVGGVPAAWEGVLFILAVFSCVMLHEFGHALAARAYGIATPDITLLPIGGLARLERMPEDPWQEFVIAIAGPLVNVVIAAAIIAALGGWVGLEGLSQIDNPRADFLARLASVNVFLVAFNLIPAFPMDGGRVLRAALATRLSWSRATRLAAKIGQVIAVVFGILGLLYNPFLVLIAVFVYLSATAEARNAEIRGVARGARVGDVMITDFARLPRSASIDQAVETMLATTQDEFPVVEADGRLAGLLTREDITGALRQSGPAAPAAAAMRRNVPAVRRSQRLGEAWKLMRDMQAPSVVVIDGHGRLVGLLTQETIGEMLMIRAAAPGGFRFGRLRRKAPRP